MSPHLLFVALVFSFVPVTAYATEWQSYVIPSTGATVDIPVNIFTEDGGQPEGGTGRRFFTRDHRADLTLQSVPNPENDSPATFLEKQRPPDNIQYRRVTPRFFAVSSVRNGRTWYNRCNRANHYMNCVLINYPAAEERQWDAVVTRISLFFRHLLRSYSGKPVPSNKTTTYMPWLANTFWQLLLSLVLFCCKHC